MKLYVTHFSGKTAVYESIRIPAEGEIYKGEIVNKTVVHDPPRNGYHAYVWLRRI